MALMMITCISIYRGRGYFSGVVVFFRHDNEKNAVTVEIIFSVCKWKPRVLT